MLAQTNRQPAKAEIGSLRVAFQQPQLDAGQAQGMISVCRMLSNTEVLKWVSLMYGDARRFAKNKNRNI